MLEKTQPNCFKLFLNREIISVNPAAHAPQLVLSRNVSTIVKRDSHNDGPVAVVLLSRHDRGSLTLRVSWGQLGLPTTATACKVRDLIAQTDLLPPTTGSVIASVGSHGAQMLRVSCSNIQLTGRSFVAHRFGTK